MAWESDRKQPHTMQWHRRNAFRTSAGTRRARAVESASRLLRVPALEPSLCTCPVLAKTLVFPRSSGGGGPRGLGPEGWRASNSWRSSQFVSDSKRSNCFKRRKRCNGLRDAIACAMQWLAQVCALQAIRECLQAIASKEAIQSPAEAIASNPVTCRSTLEALDHRFHFFRKPLQAIQLQAQRHRASRAVASKAKSSRIARSRF
jgi:hypothetical protein